MLERGATAPQLRRFIKSRAYVPMHELRRRFAINGADDEVTAVDLERRRVFVGLPEREGRLLGELLRGGDIGYELSLDPITPDRRRRLPDAPGDARLTLESATRAPRNNRCPGATQGTPTASAILTRTVKSATLPDRTFVHTAPERSYRHPKLGGVGVAPDWRT